MKTLFKKSFSCFFALTLLFSPLAGPYLAPKAEAQLGGAIAGCLGGYVAGLIGSFLSFLEVPVSDTKNTIKECMDSIAFALAKTLLAKMTDSIINWINTGFEGNPFYVGDTGSFFKNVIRDELEFALDDLKRTGTVYFDILRQEAIYGARRNLGDILGYNLDADIVSSLCGYAEYENYEFCSQQLTPEAQAELSYAFARGYIPFQWSTWDSLTQHCGNNVFCSNTYALNYQLAQRQERLQQLNTELNRGGGFLDQKVCADPGFKRDLANWNTTVNNYATNPLDPTFNPLVPANTTIPDKIEMGNFPPRPECQSYIIQTPGRIIADKLTSNLGTTERQYELADELNESIAAIFDALISKLINDGLSSFTGGGSDYDSEGNYIGDDAYYQYQNNQNSGFDYDSTITSLDQNPEVCERAGGMYDIILEVCDFGSGNESPSERPQFPWTLDDGTIIEDDQDLAVLITANPQPCIQIDELRIKEGAEPCITGVSSSSNTGQAALTVNPNPVVVGQTATLTISNGPSGVDFAILYLGNDGDFQSLATGITNTNGDGTASIRIPNINGSEITIIVDVSEGELIRQVIRVIR